MLPLNGYQLYLPNKLRREDCVRLADRHRLAELMAPEATLPTPKLMLAWLGGALVALGERLQAEAEHELILRRLV